MTKDKATTMTEKTLPGIATSGRNTLTFDVTLYEKFLDESNATIEQKHAFLESLWSIAVGFVDLGFEIHPLQLAAAEGCGQNAEIGELIAKKPEIVVGSKNTFNIKSKHSGGGQSGLSQEGSQE